MFFKLKGNHQGANPSLYRKYGQELLMWAGIIWPRKIVFGKLKNFATGRRQKTTTLSISYLANVLKTRFRL